MKVYRVPGCQRASQPARSGINLPRAPEGISRLFSSIHFHRFSSLLPFPFSFHSRRLVHRHSTLLHTHTHTRVYTLSLSFSLFHRRVPASCCARRETNPRVQFPRGLSRSRHWSAVTASETSENDKKRPRRGYTSLLAIFAGRRKRGIMTSGSEMPFTPPYRDETNTSSAPGRFTPFHSRLPVSVFVHANRISPSLLITRIHGTASGELECQQIRTRR